MASRQLLYKGLKLIKEDPDSPIGYNYVVRHYTKDLSNKDNIKEALPYAKKELELKPEPMLFHCYSRYARFVKDFPEALWALNNLLALFPDNGIFIGHKGIILYNMGNIQEGIQYLQNSVNLIKTTPTKDRDKWMTASDNEFVEIFKALCDYYMALPQHKMDAFNLVSYMIKYFPCATQQFIPYIKQANFAQMPMIGEMLHNEAIKFQSEGNLEMASTKFMESCKHLPTLAQPHFGASQCLRFIGQHELSLSYMEKAWELEKDNMGYLAQLMHLLKATCRWKQFSEKFTIVQSMIDSQNYAILKEFRSSAMYWGFSMELQYILMKQYINSLPFSSKIYAHNPSQKSKLKIAYISSNFINHAQGAQLGTYFQYHDKSKFEVFAISTYPAISEPAIKRQNQLKSQVENWIDIHNMTPKEIAQLIKSHKIDIAIDLCGHADHAQIEIYASHPAPVQISFLGYPGTTGAPYMDFYVGDPISTPPSMYPYFSEQLMIMPYSYQVTEHKGEHPPKTFVQNPKRSQIIFCNYNQPVKIEHKLFKVWMNILKQVPNSILWLLDHTATEQVHKEAKDLGINTSRIVFQKPIEKREHLKRMQKADLLLDTTIYNAHTSAGDALWAGLPILTILGDTMPSRVCAGMITAFNNFPEMITHNLDEYQQRAIHLGNNPTELRDMRKRIEQVRENSPLFDTSLFVKHFEQGLQTAYNQAINKSFKTFHI